MRRSFLGAILLCAGALMAQVPKDSLQMIVVTTSSWTSVNGTAERWQRKNPGDKWHRVSDGFPVAVGRKGLAWGRGLHNVEGYSGPVKKEGDDKAPAGIFSLTAAFGYSPRAETQLPYVQATDQLQCVDDPKSSHYNQLMMVHANTERDWNSAEQMRRDDDLYKYGIVVAHNAPPAEAGAGSCIFLHSWKRMGDGTAGCTAMDPLNIELLLSWLNEDKHPVLVQLPIDVYFANQKTWGLPKK
ncbi:MAG TPA: L,D-transpeptidase family protein [Candidatus Acidoferrales bacterium]|nr:L,D-transpeptidase family protein [Candidatus Acidoferrales bacterium]